MYNSLYISGFGFISILKAFSKISTSDLVKIRFDFKFLIKNFKKINVNFR